MNEELKTFLEELKSKPDVLGVIMFGSWARGDNRPNSDVDLIVILTEGYRRTVEYKNKQAFEIIYTTEKSALDFWQSKKDDCYDLWNVAKVLYDKEGAVNRLRVEADKIIKAGKKPIDEYQKEQYKFSAEDELTAVKVKIKTDPATANLVLSKSVLFLTELFFNLRQMWVPAPKQRLAKIRETSPKLAELFEQFYVSSIFDKRIELVEKIIPLIFQD